MGYELTKAGELYGAGGADFEIINKMFAVYDNSAKTSSFGFGLSIPTTGTFVNCTRKNATTLTLTNPTADTTFTFPLQILVDVGQYDTYSFTGVLYKSLGGVNISTTLVRNTLSESTNQVSLLCKSPNIHPYSYNLPNGSAPYNLGDFRWYTPTAAGGSKAGYYRPVGASSADRIPWQTTYYIMGTGSKIFREISGKPFSSSRLYITGPGNISGTSSTYNLNTAGERGMHKVVSGFNSEPNAITRQFTVKTQHYNGSAWVDGDSVTFDVYYAGKPYTIGYSSPNRMADMSTINYTSSNGASNNVILKYSVNCSDGWKTNQVTLTSDSQNGSITVSSGMAIPSGADWKLESYYNGTWYTEGQGQLP